MEAIFGCFFFFPLFSFFFFKPPQICNAASFISKLLSPPPQILLPLLVPLLQGGTPFGARDSLPQGSRASDVALGISCCPTQRSGLPLTCLLISSGCLLAFCSSKHRSSAWPLAKVSSSSCLAVSTLHWLQSKREDKPQPINDISEQAGLGGDTLWLLGHAPKVSCHTLQLPRIQHQGIRYLFFFFTAGRGWRLSVTLLATTGESPENWQEARAQWGKLLHFGQQNGFS